MPERHSIESFINPGNPEGSFEFEGRADFHGGNPDLRSLDEVKAADAAKAHAESAHSSAEKAPTPHGAARILTLYIMHMRRNKQAEHLQTSSQDDYDLAG